MSDVRNGVLATLIPFGLLLLFWELKVRKNHWFRASSEGFVNVKKIASVAIPVLMVLWLALGIGLTYKYASERADLRDLASKDMTHFVAVPFTNTVPAVIPKETAQKAADAIRFSRLSDTITAVKRPEYDESEKYMTFWSELQVAYGTAGVILPAILIGRPGFPTFP